MNNFEPLPLEDEESYVVPLTGENQQPESAPGSIFPALVSEMGEQGEIQPLFRREVVKRISEWLSEMCDVMRDDLPACYFEGEVLVCYRSGHEETRSEILADEDGLYPLGMVMPFGVLGGVSQPDADAALLADDARFIPEDDEVTVGLGIDDDEPPFPALIGDERWNGAVIPRFRREVAEVVAAWTNEVWRRYPDGGERAYWEEDDLVLLRAHCNGGGVAERVCPDEDGRYAIGASRWIWDLTD